MRRAMIVVLVAVAALVADVLVVGLWLPDWEALESGTVPESAYMHRYQEARQADPRLPPLRFVPVPFGRISPHFLRAVVRAEDSTFYQHHGIDWFEVAAAVERALAQGKLRGASTITAQVARNLYLSGDRSFMRKWHEFLLTHFLEQRLSKTKILNLYCNIAEFGVGLYGVEAASQRYFGISAAALSMPEAVALVATLPSPKKDNPKTATASFRRRQRRIFGLMGR